MAGRDMEKNSATIINLDKFRNLVKCYVDRHQYDSALFWADKVASLSHGEAVDIFWYAQTLYLTGQYHRAANIIKSHELDKKYTACRYLRARCYFCSKDYQEALATLDQLDTHNVLSTPAPMARSYPGAMHTSFTTNTHISTQSTSRHINTQVAADSNDADLSVLGTAAKLESSVHLLRGEVYEKMDNRNLAAECFREALRADVFCYEAFTNLVNHHMLTAKEEQDLLNSLPFDQQCSDEERELTRFIYESQLKKYHKPSALKIPRNLDSLKDNVDIIVCLAERYYYNCDFRAAFKITSAALKQDMFNSKCLPVHIVTLVELNKHNELFSFAHKLVSVYPSNALSWFAIGCYYLLVGKNEPARRYFSKATSLNRVFGPAWLAYGHSFAVENEHDQAMATYFTSAQLMKGCHLPVMYIGLEYGLTNNTKLAERFFGEALSIAPEDPFVLHEMGVVAYQNKEYDVAHRHFCEALKLIEVVSKHGIVETWEPLLNNLGHTCRKLRQYPAALDYHQRALTLQPKNSSTLAAIGYIHTLTGNGSDAIDYFHKALSLKRDDSFVTTMLNRAIERLMTDMSPVDDIPDPLPTFTSQAKLSSTTISTDEPQSKLPTNTTSYDDSDLIPTPGTSSTIGRVTRMPAAARGMSTSTPADNRPDDHLYHNHPSQPADSHCASVQPSASLILPPFPDSIVPDDSDIMVDTSMTIDTDMDET